MSPNTVKGWIQLFAAIITIATGFITAYDVTTDDPDVIIIHVQDKFEYQGNYFLEDVKGNQYLVTEDEYNSVRLDNGH